MNRGTLPNYTFKKNESIASRSGENLPIICGKTQVSKVAGGLTVIIELRCEVAASSDWIAPRD
jgi:hypothetical protein